MDGITLKQLKAIVDYEVKQGNGDKTILISTDDEGNGFHTLFFGITSKTKDMKETLKYAHVHDDYDINNIVLLG